MLDRFLSNRYSTVDTKMNAGGYMLNIKLFNLLARRTEPSSSVSKQ